MKVVLLVIGLIFFVPPKCKNDILVPMFRGWGAKFPFVGVFARSA